jgi:GTP-dependent phosphoenolpyruvate carboxykinase
MKYEEKESAMGGSRITIEFNRLDFLSLVGTKLTDDDRHFIDQCKKSKRISDKIQGLAFFARKIEENS